MTSLYTDLEVRVREFARRARRDEGATAVEYGLLVALIAAVIITAVRTIGTNLTNSFTTVGDAVKFLEKASAA